MVVHFDRLKLFKGDVQVKKSTNTDLTHPSGKDTHSSSPSLTSHPLKLYDDDDDDDNVDNEAPASSGAAMRRYPSRTHHILSRFTDFVSH